ncbi:hypothetical protein ACHRBH_18100, partial [Acinetobacter baumannii]
CCLSLYIFMATFIGLIMNSKCQQTLIKNKVENKGLGKVAQETNQSKAQAAIMVSCARFYIAGHDKRLKNQ